MSIANFFWSLFDENFNFSKNRKNINLFSKLSPDLKRASKTGMKTLSMIPGCGFLDTLCKTHLWSLFDKKKDYKKSNNQFFMKFYILKNSEKIIIYFQN